MSQLCVRKYITGWKYSYHVKTERNCFHQSQSQNGTVLKSKDSPLLDYEPRVHKRGVSPISTLGK